MTRLSNKPVIAPETLACLNALERKVLWLSAWTVHNANHLRPARDGLKVGGHQASCASVATLMTALYFDVLGPNDRVAVKPHASPVFHAIQYLFGKQTRAKLENFRALGGAQSYPSRTKDSDDVDISTGSVGLGVGMTLFASMVQDYVRFHKLAPAPHAPGRMIAVMGDAELDEGNVFEALLEGWKHDVRNLWWIIDYNRQSLDRVVSDRLFQKIKDFFQAVGWEVVILKYGYRQQAAFAKPGGAALREWIDDCPNELYCALTFKGGAAWRARLSRDIGHVAGMKALLAGYDDDGLQDLMTNLAGHDMEAVLEALHAVRSDVPHCFIMYTIKGFGLPFAGHKDNHAGLMTGEQMADFRAAMGIAEGAEWSPFAGLPVGEEALANFIAAAPFNGKPPRATAPPVPLPDALPFRPGARLSTQEAFGRILNDLGKGESPLASRIVTTSPDVTVSTNLGGWVNQRGIFDRADREDVFRSEKVVSMQKWSLSRNGQHIELGIAENNLFLLLAALGLSDQLFGARLLPVGTVYDPFIARGLDALNYACYQDARFLLAGTPSGITLAPEGGAHQSVGTPLLAMGQPGLASFEPAFADELAEILLWGFGHLQAPDGGAVYCRLSTRAVDQPARAMDEALRRDLLAGGYWLVEPAEDAALALAFSGAVVPEARAAHEALADEIPGVGLLAVTSADRLYAGWLAAAAARARGEAPGRPSHVEGLLARLPPDAAVVTVLDGHPAGLSWLGTVAGHRPYPLGVTGFGESGDIPALYAKHRIDTDAILDMAALACVERARRRG